MFERTDDFIGGSLQGECLISPARLVEVFGKPGDGDDYKVSGEYAFIDPDTGESFTLYDWKHTTLYDYEGEPGVPTPDEFWVSNEPYAFHIGGKPGECDVLRIAAAIKQIAAGQKTDYFAPDPREREVFANRLAATRIVIKHTREEWDKQVRAAGRYISPGKGKPGQTHQYDVGGYGNPEISLTRDFPAGSGRSHRTSIIEGRSPRGAARQF